MRINSIFKSINGEINHFHQGSLCTFIRLQGCNLNCKYPCDTPYGRNINEGMEMSTEEVFNEVEKLKCKNITVTGGEPLLQFNELLSLTQELKKRNYKISVETNGSIRIKPIYLIDSWVIDFKGSSSGEKERMVPENFFIASRNDVIKFVIKSKEEFEDALCLISSITALNTNVTNLPVFAFSPVFNTENKMGTDPSQLVEWIKSEDILQDLRTVMSVQIHKMIGVS